MIGKKDPYVVMKSYKINSFSWLNVILAALYMTFLFICKLEWKIYFILFYFCLYDLLQVTNYVLQNEEKWSIINIIVFIIIIFVQTPFAVTISMLIHFQNISFLMVLQFALSLAIKSHFRSRSLNMVAFPKRLPTNFDLKSSELKSEEKDRVKRCITFIDNSPEPFHCVKTVSDLLINVGFTPIQESSIWRGMLKKGGKVRKYRLHVLCLELN